MKEGFYIHLPYGCEGDLTLAQFGKLCKYFDCELQPKKRGWDCHRILTQDPINFFWLGANMAFQGHGCSLSQTIKEKIKNEG